MATRIIPSVYRHEQTTPSTTWTVEHNLGGAGGNGVPIVDVVINSGGNKVKALPLQVSIVDKHTVTIEFSAAQTGTAIVVA